MSITEDKMYAIAKHYNYLNDKGNVKAIKGNEKGYAKILDITRGCSLLVTHRTDDTLTINLSISPSAKTRYQSYCNNAVEVFKAHFNKDAKYEPWTNVMDGKALDRYFVDVTRVTLSDLIILIENIRNKLAVS